MTVSASIHPIPVPKRSPSGPGADGGRGDQLLLHCRAKVLDQLGDTLKAMLDQADDALFELANKSVNTTEQAQYFDAMRELRLKRKSITEDFAACFTRSFDEKCRTQRNAPLDFRSLEEGGMEFALVADDDMEEQIAVSNMHSKVASNCQEELFALDKRMAALLGKPTLEADDNPLGPKTICGAFREACSCVDSGVTIRLIILKLFDKYVLSTMSDLYQGINCFLADNDVLPQIRTQVTRRGSRRPAAPGAAPPPETVEEAEQDMLATLQRLVDLRAAQGQGRSGTLSGSATAAGPVMVKVITGLTTLQHGEIGAVAGTVDAQALSCGRVNILRDLKSGAVIGTLGDDDKVIIDIVAMLFDYILDDDNIPDSMKALIGRLQIPLLKVALLDRSFFSRKSHPARRLLDTLADGAIGWNESADEGDGLFDKAEEIVHRILNEFEDDIGLFASLAEELQSFLDCERRQAQQRVDRSAEVLKRKERLQEAKQVVRAEVEFRTATMKDDFLRPFLLEHWQNLLVILHLKHGPASKSWASGLSTMDDLIWSVEPKQCAEERQRLVTLLPQLVRRLRNGMKLIALSDESTQAFLDVLAQRHASAVRSEAALAELHPPARPAAECPEQGPPQADEGAVGAEPLAEEPRVAAPAAPLTTAESPEDVFAQALAQSHESYYERPAVTPELEGEPIDAGLEPDGTPGRDPMQRPSAIDGAVTAEAVRVPEALQPEVTVADGAIEEDITLEAQCGPEGPAPGGEPQDLEATIPEPIPTTFARAGWLQFSAIDADMEIEEITLGEAAPEIDESQEFIDDEHLQHARDLATGSWVEFSEGGGLAKRARLSWVSSATGVYLFTDRKGIKVAERTLFGLAAEFRRGTARVIESVPLIDRAVSNLLNGFAKTATAP